MTETAIAKPDTPAVNPRRLPKSRNGCQQCKVRKLKCDETRPACKNCIRRGNDCPGYTKVLKWSTKHEVHKQPRKSRATFQQSDYSSNFSASPISTTSAAAKDASPTLPFPESLTEDFPDERATKRARKTPPTEIDPEITNAAAATTEQRTQEDDDVIELPRSSDEDFLSIDESPLFALLQNSGLQTASQNQASAEPQSKALLRTFYRLPPATPQAALMDTGSYLIQHYFQDVCTIFSSFDSSLNPFRMTISRLWTDSAPIYYAIQSMAAAHLANTYPQMSVVGVEMQKKAGESLEQELQLAVSGETKPDRSLLTLLLLGLSACWHRPNDLGLGYLRAARTLMCNKLLQDKPMETKEQQRQDQFFEEALVYWEMMMGYVAPAVEETGAPPIAPPTQHHFPLPQQGPQSSESKVLPHPWTGVAPRAQILLAEVGRLVREERMSYRTELLDLEAHLAASQRRFSVAQALEEELLSIEPPDPESLVDVGDEKTSKKDFLIIAEATRCAALLDLYRIFPDMLTKRLGPEAAESDPSPSSSSSEATISTPKSNIAFLNSLATHTLSLIESLPSESGTRFLQLMLIVITASELRFTSSAAPYGINLDFFDPSSDDAKVAHARTFAEQRLEEHARRLPAKPVRRMLEIVREVWRRFDELLGVFWLDVVLDRGWETVMG
ncbi:hypothetical protein NA57DRAFT_38240 [Rhizodiscina lignyota]|uniref:Zn(2)-C6 fungal-type domain-containing protein n=1 Tax=Rhizodiscina lignyota TaxID=1504668 RepID=A0A9P4MBT7_9PEZI|nr:hypothetical protein NA57DRAFT_38240 [Rhizodiscina lignyota]